MTTNEFTIIGHKKCRLWQKTQYISFSGWGYEDCYQCGLRMGNGASDPIIWQIQDLEKKSVPTLCCNRCIDTCIDCEEKL